MALLKKPERTPAFIRHSRSKQLFSYVIFDIFIVLQVAANKKYLLTFTLPLLNSIIHLSFKLIYVQIM